MSLGPLLQILNDPGHPSFAQAVAQLDGLDLARIPRAEFPALLAQIEQTIAIITAAKQATSSELEKLRKQAQAVNSYGLVK